MKIRWLNLENFWGTWCRWQNRRPLWLLIGFCGLGLELFSWAFFQSFLGLKPCELCVYIRFSMLVIFLGGIVGALNPRFFINKLIGYGLLFWGIIQGLKWDISLAIENIKARDPDNISLCSQTVVNFPLGLPLDRWFPAHFFPQEICGKDSGWSFLGLDMAQWLFFVYGAFLAISFLMVFAYLLSFFKKAPPLQ